MQKNIDNHGGGIGTRQMEPALGQDPLGGTGGSAGGGTIAGEGEPSGGVTDDDTEFSDEHPLASPGELAGTADQAIAREIEALGPADGSLADAAEEQDADDGGDRRE